MKSRLFEETSKTLKTSAGKWVRILPDNGDGYNLIDLVEGAPLGRLLVDGQGRWIYDGDNLGLNEQDEVAGQITGHQKEMTDLLKTLGI